MRGEGRQLRAALGLAGLACTFLAALVLWMWPGPARPAMPLAPLRVVAGPASPHLAAALDAPRPGLAPLPLTVEGRAAAGPDGGLVQEWPGFHVEARFHGDAVTIRFEDEVNLWRVLIEGGAAGRVELARPGRRDLRISGLGPGDWRIRVEKISESSMPAGFGGIWIDPAAARPLPAPPPPPRLIEFVGDSDTVGFADLSDHRDCTEDEVFATTDTSRSFGPQVAARLGADYRLIARSGIGLLRNYGGAAPTATMASRHAMALPSDVAALPLPERPADIVVTALGSNDFGSALAPDEPWPDHDRLSRDFGPALTAFLRQRRQAVPGALQVLLAFGEYGPPLVDPYREAAAALRADGARVALVVLPRLDRHACFWHPTAADHALIARELALAIRAAEP